MMDLIVFFAPLLSFVIAIFCSFTQKHQAFVWFISSSLITIATITSCMLIFDTQYYMLNRVLYNWFSLENTKIYFSIYLDTLSIIMLMVINIVSAVVHIYSYGYMSEDKNFIRFIAYLSLFTFFMIVLVTSENFIQLFCGWEGVGFCSYLLIGFWHHKDSASIAANKAFIVNRIGDFGLLIGIMMLVVLNNDISLFHIMINSHIYNIFGFAIDAKNIIGILFLIGAMGKSAQIGLHIWLPDAMEGPTPVSALIHAATMVPAGVFLLSRCLFALESDFVSDIILWIGSITCLFGSITAVTQEDIKKIIAYSTCSQLGYMFMAIGVYNYDASIFHLITHAFFKALLFLYGGIVIHATHEQNIFNLGGLAKKLPITYILFIIGSLAIMGFYPFSGYYSKDLILESVYNNGHNIAFIIGVMSIFFTAIYSMKILILTFHRHNKSYKSMHITEPMVMILPLLILAFGSIFLGGMIFNEFGTHLDIPTQIKYAPLIVAYCGAFIGFVIYQFKLEDKLSAIFRMSYILSKNKFFFDELYNITIIPLIFCISRLSNFYDLKILDKYGPGGVAKVASKFSQRINIIQNGFIYNYALLIFIGLIAILNFLIYIFKIGL